MSYTGPGEGTLRMFAYSSYTILVELPHWQAFIPLSSTQSLTSG